jgi:hypothetical protein
MSERSARAARARNRRERATVRVLRPGEQDDGTFDAEFWARLSAEERVAAVWQATLDWAALRGISPARLRLRRSVVGIRRG